MKSGVKDPRFPEPYYPHFDPALHPKKQKKLRHIKKRPDVYEKDTKAYYGPIAKYEVINTLPKDGKKVKIIMKDLSELNPSQEKINELQKQLNNLNNFISLPKNMMKGDKNRHPYYPDPKPYYDPTKADVNKKKAYLQNKINLMKKNLALLQKQKGPVPELYKYEKAQGHIYVENKDNVLTEAYNTYVNSMLDDEPKRKKNKSPALGSKITANMRIESHHYKPLNSRTNPNSHHKAKKAKVQTPEEHRKNSNMGGITFSTVSSNYDTTKKVDKKEEEKTWKSGKDFYLLFN